MPWETEFSRKYGLSRQQTAACAMLLDELAGRSDRGLTAVTGRERLLDVHFRDSLALLGFPELDTSKKVIDVGSGAGFPGLPLAIARPEIHFSLLEANARKCEFIRQMLSLLELENVDIINSRAEELARTLSRESYDLALARAVAPMPTVLEYSLPLISIGGYALLQRGRRETGDMQRAEGVAGLLGGELERIEPVHPYPSAENLNVWVFSKQGSTESRFPRRPGIPAKRPL